MNDARFKELLNLHIDHRLTADEARELEAVLQASVERRREFRHYAALQRGCAELFNRSATDAPAPDALVRALRAAEARMSARDEPRLLIWGWGTWGATAGVAAIIALVLARVSQPVYVAVIAAPSPAGAPSPVRTPAGLAANSGSLAPAYVSARSTLPAHLTLAALGISSEQDTSSVAVSRWQSTDEPQVARSDSSAPQVASWMSDSVAEWNGVAMPSGQFGSRPINAWAGQTGYQIQAAGYTFER